jgi:hypothetical protein
LAKSKIILEYLVYLAFQLEKLPGKTHPSVASLSPLVNPEPTSTAPSTVPFHHQITTTFLDPLFPLFTPAGDYLQLAKHYFIIAILV